MDLQLKDKVAIVGGASDGIGRGIALALGAEGARLAIFARREARLSPAASIALIHQAGGVAVLAHLYQLKLATLEATEQLIVELAALGLDGVEAIYSRHSEDERRAYAEMARRHGLLITGGSDYHGTYKPDLRLVRGKGDLAVPYELLDELKRRAAARKQAAKGN